MVIMLCGLNKVRNLLVSSFNMAKRVGKEGKALNIAKNYKDSVILQSFMGFSSV